MKRIILLSDGTGNSSAKLFKTNVWRLYQSLDLETDTDGVRQIACYNDGVGTSAFKPLALLGGGFGYGLKRNILHLYDFLCEHWEPGDEIYAFGFSRGAFTARILAGMIAREGLLTGVGKAELAYATRDIYRRYRRDPRVVISDPWLVRPFRAARDRLIHVWRRLMHEAEFPPAGLTQVPHLAFVGAWDTVAAYGSPLAELTRGIDQLIFPLSMPDRALNAKVLVARHALSLDDERDTFHPLLWDERGSPHPERIRQVWFAGMHADVGGGYPDDSLSYEPLAWMMREAEQAGLRFLPGAHDRFAPPPSRSAPLHDSRRGLAGYYRYQPRRLEAYLSPHNPQASIMVDPRRKARAHLRAVHLHHSVLDRIRTSVDRYAPIVLPASFEVVQPDGSLAPDPQSHEARSARMNGQAGIWDQVWRRRVNYFATVALSAVLATLPFWASGPDAGSCAGWPCAASPLFRALGAFLPAVLGYWTDAFAAHSGKTMLLMAGLALLLLRSARLQQSIQDGMWPLLAPLRDGTAAPAGPPATWLRRLRTNPTYLRGVALLKWQVLPLIGGTVMLGAMLVISVAVLGTPVLRAAISHAERTASLCPATPGATGGLFRTDDPCWPSPAPVKAGVAYRIELTIGEPWMDGTIPASPEGLEDARFPWLGGYRRLPWRRSVEGRWFQPFASVGEAGARQVQPLEFRDQGRVFVASLVPRVSGPLVLWVNEAVRPFAAPPAAGYRRHRGTARICIVEQGGICPGSP